MEKTIVVGAFFLFFFSNVISGVFGIPIPIIKYVWIGALIVFVIYVIKISNILDRSLKTQGTDIKTEYNRFGDSELFQRATRGGVLKVFDPFKVILMIAILPFSCFGLVLGILALHLIFIEHIMPFTILPLIFILVGSGVSFMFFFEDKRVLNEARRRDEFVKEALRRWNVSKYIYAGMILLAFMVSGILIATDHNFLETSVLEVNDKVLYDGRK